MAEVVALDDVEIVAKVVESQIPYVHVGDMVRVEVPSLATEILTGTVEAIVPQADVRSRTFPVKVLVHNQISDHDIPLLKAGMLARLTLRTGQAQQALLVPKDALVLQGKEPIVWIVNKDSIGSADNGMQQGNVRPVPVQLGVADGDLIQVQGDVRAGDLVIVKGNERIAPPTPQRPSQVMWAASSQTNSAAVTNEVTHGTH